MAVHFLAYEDIKGVPNSTNLLPTNRLVSHTLDNDAAVVSEMNGVFGKSQREINPKLCIQQCTTHTGVLADRQTEIPSFVKKIGYQGYAYDLLMEWSEKNIIV